MRVKICGITQPEQGAAIAQLGATSLGFICFPKSPRYVSPEQIRCIVEHLPRHPRTGQPIDRVGVFVDAPLEAIAQVVAIAHLNCVQLHGSESPEFCQSVRATLSQIEIIKALRVRDLATLLHSHDYAPHVDALLLDAYDPAHHGGTGKTLDWTALNHYRPACPWILAGGLTPDNVHIALTQTNPDGIDLSSGVERSPGDKDLEKVAQLFQTLHQLKHRTETLPPVIAQA